MGDPEAGPADSRASAEEADTRRAIEARAAWQAVSSAFGSLGRAFMCANGDFRVIHGSYVLDEVGDLPLSSQVKLLRVRQDGTFERLGENTTRTSHARVIAATHVDLTAAVRERRFRDDRGYRLRVVPLEMPALRERREDIEPIENQASAGFSKEVGKGKSFDVAVTRAFAEEISGPNALEAPGAQTIKLKMDQWDVTVGYSVKF